MHKVDKLLVCALPASRHRTVRLTTVWRRQAAAAAASAHWTDCQLCKCPKCSKEPGGFAYQSTRTVARHLTADEERAAAQELERERAAQALEQGRVAQELEWARLEIPLIPAETDSELSMELVFTDIDNTFWGPQDEARDLQDDFGDAFADSGYLWGERT